MINNVRQSFFYRLVWIVVEKNNKPTFTERKNSTEPLTIYILLARSAIC
jgi:hypothetical protein